MSYFMNVMFIIHDIFICVFFFKQKTAYEMRISDWSSDVCSSDLKPADLNQVASSFNITCLQEVSSLPTFYGMHCISDRKDLAIVSKFPISLVFSCEDRKSTRLNSSH